MIPATARAPIHAATAFLFCAATLVGCGGGSEVPRHERAPVQDYLAGKIGSAGYPAANTEIKRTFDNPAVRFILEEDLKIGGTTDRVDEILTRVSGIKIDANGNIFAVQPDDRTIRVYNAEGKFLRAQGREGQGPGEFTGFGYFGFNHDSLWVTDPSQNRVSLFGPDGKIIRYLTASVSPPNAPYGSAPPLAYMEDGSILVRFAMNPEEPVSPEFSRPPDLIMRANAKGELLDTVYFFDMPKDSIIQFENVRMLARRPINNYPYVVFAPDGSQAVIVERSPPVNPDSAAFTVVRVGADGTRKSEVRYSYTPRRIPRKTIDSLLPVLPDSAPERARLMAKLQREHAQLPPYLPPINLTVVGRDGTIWISSVWADNRYRWTIIDRNNEIMGYADIPAGFRLLQADLNNLWGTAADADGVPFIVRYKVTRAPR